MLTIGDAAPRFDCTAIVNGEAVSVTWNQLHDRRILVLLFDSLDIEDDSPAAFAGLNRAVGRIGRLGGNLAVVSGEHPFEILNCLSPASLHCAIGGPACPIIADHDRAISALYEMVAADGEPIWGHIIIDPAGRIRQVVMYAIPIALNVDELVRCLEAIREESADKWPCPPQGDGPELRAES